MEKSRRENINSRFAIVISCFETTLDIVSAFFGRCGQMLGALAMMAGTIAMLYEPTSENPAAAVPGRKKATAPPVCVACVGNSITYVTGIQDSARDSYPAQLQRMLGPGYVRRGLYIKCRAWATRSSCALTMPTDSPRPTARPRRHLR